MADRRIVQCFGTLVRPRKPAKPCRRKYRWSAKGASYNFGPKGVQACPHCGTMPDFKHPINRYWNGELTQEQAQELLQRDYNPDWTKKEEAEA